MKKQMPTMRRDFTRGLVKFGKEAGPAFKKGLNELGTLSKYEPLTRELVGPERYDRLKRGEGTAEDVISIVISLATPCGGKVAGKSSSCWKNRCRVITTVKK
jgi:hypothetical protein